MLQTLFVCQYNIRIFWILIWPYLRNSKIGVTKLLFRYLRAVLEIRLLEKLQWCRGVFVSLSSSQSWSALSCPLHLHLHPSQLEELQSWMTAGFQVDFWKDLFLSWRRKEMDYLNLIQTLGYEFPSWTTTKKTSIK